MDLPPPTYQDIQYSSHYEQSVLDIWLPQSNEPTPVFVFFHGGAFQNGNKYMPQDAIPMLEAGVALVAVEYPFIGQAHQETGEVIKDLEAQGYFAILEETQNAIQFLIDHADEYNLNTDRMILGGSSAGTVIVEYLTYGTAFPIAACVGLSQPYGIEEYSPFIHPKQTPLFLLSRSGPDDEVHHPKYTRIMADICRERNIPVTIFGNDANDLPLFPDHESFIAYAYRVTAASWKSENEQP